MLIQASQRLLATSTHHLIEDSYDLGYTCAKEGRPMCNDSLREFIKRLDEGNLDREQRAEIHNSYRKGFITRSEEELHDVGFYK